jgi:hypothetical protein
LELSDKKIHGRYIGILLGPASHGATFADCLVEMTINETGVALPFTETDTKEPGFQVHYPPGMVFHLLNWGVDDDLAIRQHPTSSLAQVIIQKVSWYKRLVSFARFRAWADIGVVLGEGMPMPLMLFVREKRGEKMLRRLYKQVFAVQSNDYYNEEKWRQDHLVPVDFSEIERVVTRGTVAEKAKLIESLGHNLWTGSQEKVAERIKVLDRFLTDTDLVGVRSKVMQQFTLGVRAVEAVPLIQRQYAWLQTQDFNDPAVGMYAKHVAHAARCLLYEAYSHLKPKINIKKRFGSLDLGNIHVQQDGVLDARDQSLFTDFFHSRDVTPSREWTVEHYKTLRSISLELHRRLAFMGARDEGELEEYASLYHQLGVLQEQTQKLH